MGRQIGEALKDRMQSLLPSFQLMMKQSFSRFFFLKRPFVKLFFNRKVSSIEKFIPAEYVEEMKGMAEGAGVDYRTILTLNVLYEFIHSCSAFVIKKEDGTLLHGRNLDYYMKGLPLGESGVAVLYRPERGHVYLSITFTGMAGVLSGMNDAGLSVTLNEVSTGKKTFRHIPMTFLLKKILQSCDNLACAERLVAGSRLWPGINLVVASKKDRSAAVFEVAGGIFGVRKLEGDYLIATNHFLTEKMKNLDLTVLPSNSLKRYLRLKQLLSEKACPGGIRCLKDLKDIQTGLLCLWGHTPDRPITLQSMVFLNNRLRVRLAMGAGYAPDREWIEVDLKSSLEAGKPVIKTVIPPSISQLQKEFLSWFSKFVEAKGRRERLSLSRSFFRKTSYPYFAYQAAAAAFYSKQYSSALRFLQEAEKKGLSADFVLFLHARALLALKKPKEAERLLKKIRALPASTHYWAQLMWYMARYYKRIGKRKKAETYMRQLRPLLYSLRAYRSPFWKRFLLSP